MEEWSLDEWSPCLKHSKYSLGFQARCVYLSPVYNANVAVTSAFSITLPCSWILSISRLGPIYGLARGTQQREQRLLSVVQTVAILDSISMQPLQVGFRQVWSLSMLNINYIVILNCIIFLAIDIYIVILR